MKTLSHTTFTFSLTDEMFRKDARMEAHGSKDARMEAHVSKDAPIPAGRCLCSRYSRTRGIPQSPRVPGDTNPLATPNAKHWRCMRFGDSKAVRQSFDAVLTHFAQGLPIATAKGLALSKASWKAASKPQRGGHCTGLCNDRANRQEMRAQGLSSVSASHPAHSLRVLKKELP